MKTYHSKKLTLHALLSRLVLAIGVLLMVLKYMKTSEPGATPLLLIMTGAGWYFFARFQKCDRKGQIE